MLVAVYICTYFFFYYIEHLPEGTVLNDWILKKLPAEDVSVPIVILESSVILLLIIRSITDPDLFLSFLIAVIFVLIFRIITIDITRFNSPIGLIELKDPISDVVYKSGFIKRDLFYSGHVSILFLIFLCLHKKADKYYALFGVVAVGLLILIQHVHYTVDVVSAPFFSLGCFSLSKKLLQIE